MTASSASVLTPRPHPASLRVIALAVARELLPRQ